MDKLYIITDGRQDDDKEFKTKESALKQAKKEVHDDGMDVYVCEVLYEVRQKTAVEIIKR